MKIRLFSLTIIVIAIFLNHALAQQNSGKFNPDMSVILDFSYVDRTIEKEDKQINETYESLEIPGAIGETHGELNGSQGFNFNSVELVFSGAVDPFFEMDFIAGIHSGEFEVEEAYITTTQIPHGIQFKVGKFLSSFGRHNIQHQHSWYFSDPPLISALFFGPEGMSENGLQVNWIAPTDMYLSLGIETLQGENGNSFGVQGFDLEPHEVGDVSVPVVIFFAKTSFDMGNLTTLIGVSHAQGQSRLDHPEVHGDEGGSSESLERLFSLKNSGHGHGEEDEDEEATSKFAGDTTLLGLDVTFKYYFDSYRFLAFETEYINRLIDGTFYEAEVQEAEPLKKEQAGFYTQLIWRYSQTWSTGLRYDLIQQNELTVDGTKDGDLKDNLTRSTLMVDYNPTEFSKIRLQYNQDDSKSLGEEQRQVSEVILQFNMSLGAHGAHSF